MNALVQAVKNPAARPQAALVPAGGKPSAGVALQPVALGTVAPERALPKPALTPLAAGNASPFLEPGLQTGMAAAQQGLAWLEDLGQKLQGLKKGLSQQLAGGTPQSAAQTAAALRQFSGAWQQRSQKAGGMLDGQLHVVEPGQARQSFYLRGLALADLNNERAETLSFAVPGAAAPVAVAVDPAESAETLVQRLDQALAPNGVRAAVHEGDLQFSCAESQWQALRDGLSIKGDGQRFPSGQRVRVRLDAASEALQPAAWSLEGATAQRQTLGRVIEAQSRLAQAGTALGAALSKMALPVVAGAEETQERGRAALAFAQEFQARSTEPVYERYAALAPALKGVGREQVRALLKENTEIS